MSKKKINFSPLKFGVLAFLVLYTVILFILWGWGIINSLKDYYDFRMNASGLPAEWRWDNYVYVLERFKLDAPTPSGGRHIVGMAEMYLYSILYAGGCAFTATFVPCIVSYVVARYNFKPLSIIYYIVVVCMVIPLVGTLPAQVRVAINLGIRGHIWGMWIMTGHFLGMYFLVFYATFKTLPMSYTEAAKIDGASNLNIMFRVIIPLARNMFFTIFLLHFVTYWNEYQTALLFIPEYPTISLGLYYMAKSTDDRLTQIPSRLTGCILVMIPVLIVFLIFRERLMGNLSMGGLKE